MDSDSDDVRNGDLDRMDDLFSAMNSRSNYQTAQPKSRTQYNKTLKKKNDMINDMMSGDEDAKDYDEDKHHKAHEEDLALEKEKI